MRTGRSGVPQAQTLSGWVPTFAAKSTRWARASDRWNAGDAIYGVTNPSFVGGYAQYALARASMDGVGWPPQLSDVEAARSEPPVIGVGRPCKMLWTHAELEPGHHAVGDPRRGRGTSAEYAVRCARGQGRAGPGYGAASGSGVASSPSAAGVVDLDAADPAVETVDARPGTGGRSICRSQAVRLRREPEACSFPLCAGAPDPAVASPAKCPTRLLHRGRRRNKPGSAYETVVRDRRRPARRRRDPSSVRGAAGSRDDGGRFTPARQASILRCRLTPSRRRHEAVPKARRFRNERLDAARKPAIRLKRAPEPSAMVAPANGTGVPSAI